MDQGLRGWLGKRKWQGQAKDVPPEERASPTPAVTAVTVGVGESALSSHQQNAR